MLGNFLRVLRESFFVDKNIPAATTMRIAFGAVAFEFVDILRLKVKVFFRHELTRNFLGKYITRKNFCHLTAKNLQ